MKKKLSISLAAFLLASALTTAVYAAPTAADYNILIDGTQLEMLYGPLTENNRTLVPFRDIAEALGATVNWDAETKTVTCSLNDNFAQLVIGSNTMTTNNGTIALEVPAQIIDQVTYVPLRAFSQGLGLGSAVSWDAETKTISINTSIAEDTAKPALVSDYTTTKYESSIKSGSRVIVPITATYPIFKGTGRAALALNKHIADHAQSNANKYKTANTKRLYALYQQCIKDGTRDKFNDYGYNLTYDLACNNNGILSLYATLSVNSDQENSSKNFGLTLSTYTGNILGPEDILENSVDTIKEQLIAAGYSQASVNKLKLDSNSFYIKDNKIIFIINKGDLSNNAEEYALELPETKPADTLQSIYTINDNKTAASDKLLSQDNGIVMELNTRYPEFIGTSSLDGLNSIIAKTQLEAMSDYKENNRAAALAAYKLFNQTKDKKSDRFEPWLWTSDYEIKYNDNKIASVITSTYIYKGDGTEATNYNAYTCDLKTGKLINADSLISDIETTNSKARAAFRQLIDSNRLNFYTDVYERFDLSKAVKYISKDGVTYMFNPGELASVSKGVIEVTVPLS